MIPKPMASVPDLSRLHKLGKDFFEACAEAEVSQKDYNAYAHLFLLETVYAIYGDRGLKFILDHQEEYHDDNDKPDNGAT